MPTQLNKLNEAFLSAKETDGLLVTKQETINAATALINHMTQLLRDAPEQILGIDSDTCAKLWLRSIGLGAQPSKPMTRSEFAAYLIAVGSVMLTRDTSLREVINDSDADDFIADSMMTNGIDGARAYILIEGGDADLAMRHIPPVFAQL